MRWELSFRDQLDLYQKVGNAVLIALGNQSQSEPQLVANLVWQLPRALEGMRLSNGAYVNVRGVFIHSSPQVSCSSFPDKTKESVEIGDLLWVRTVLNANHRDDKDRRPEVRVPALAA